MKISFGFEEVVWDLQSVIFFFFSFLTEESEAPLDRQSKQWRGL